MIYAVWFICLCASDVICAERFSQLAKTNHRAPLVQLLNYIGKMDDEIINLDVLFLSQSNIFEMLFSIYIPTINAAIS